jgi:hypothetical protein
LSYKLEGGDGMKLAINKKYRLKQEIIDATLGKIPQGMTVTFITSVNGNARFKLPNGKQFGVVEKTALTVMEELH